MSLSGIMMAGLCERKEKKNTNKIQTKKVIRKVKIFKSDIKKTLTMILSM